MHLVIFGAGYTGRALAEMASARMQVTVVTRQLAAPPAGYRLAPFDDPAEALATATHLVATAAPEAGGDPVLHRHAHLLATAPALVWIGYLSTTGVYGDRRGAWVDETTAPTPSNPRAHRRVHAENAWAALRSDLAVDLFRLAGIYGPGRSALDQVRAGRARRVDKPGHAFGRIHRDDIAGALLAAILQQRSAGRRVLNGSDDEPASSAEVIAEAARLLGHDPPRLMSFEEAESSMSPMARSFWADDRKVRSEITQRSLGRRWLYPNFRKGLSAILAAEVKDPIN